MMQDIVDLRNNDWVPRREDNNPETMGQNHREAAEMERKTQMLLQMAKQEKKQQRGNVSGRDSLRPGAIPPQADETWTTVGRGPRNVSVDPKKFQNIKRPADSENTSLGPGGKGYVAWARGSSGGRDEVGAGAGPSPAPGSTTGGSVAEADNRPANRYSALAGERKLSAPARASSGDSRRQEPRSPVSGGGRRGRFPQEEREKALEAVRANIQTKRNAQERDGGRESPRPIPEAAPPAEPAAPAAPGPTAAASIQELTEEAMKKKTLSIIDEYLNIRDPKEAADRLREFQSPSRHHVFVEVTFNHTMEKKISDRNATGKLMHFLLRDGVLTAQQYLNGLDEIFQLAEDIEIDIPQLWKYLGELMGPSAFAGNLNLDELFNRVFNCVSKHKAAKLFAYMLQSATRDKSQEDVAAILSRYNVTLNTFFDNKEEAQEFAKDKKIEFALGQNLLSQNNTGSSTQHSARIQEQLRTVILKRKARNEEAIDWIDKNLSPADTKKSPFIRALVTAVCEGAMDRDEGGACKCNVEKLMDRKILLQRYINSNPSLEVQAVYAVQALFVGLDYPPGFIMSYFDILYDEEIVTEESFFAWQKGDEEPGKGVTVTNAQKFFRWLKSAQEAADDSWTEGTYKIGSEATETSAQRQTEKGVKKKTHSVIDENLNNGDPKAEDAQEIERVNSYEEDSWSLYASVPPEILARGRLAIEAYNKALREGTTSLKRIPVMLIGQDRSGKTSLKNSLRGEKFNPNEKSTVGIDKDPSHFQVTTELWKTGVKDKVTDSTAATSYEHHAAKLIVNSLTGEQIPTEESLKPLLPESPSMPSADTAVDEDVTALPTEFLSCRNQDETNLEHVQSRAFPTGGLRSSVPSHEKASEPPDAAISRDSTTTDVQDVKTLDGPRVNSSSLSGESEVPQDIASIVAKLLHKGPKVEDNDIYSVLWDFGGQSVYYATHPLFLTPRAIYVLVYDLSRDPCERAEPPLKQGLFKTFKDQFSLKTHLDYLYFWMTSVSSLACQTEDGEILEKLPEKLPPVFLVCSHADKPYGGKDPHTLANDIFDSLQRNPYSNHLLESVFVVDNTLSGSELECPEVVRLRQHILFVAKKLPQMKELIPIKWLKYEKALHLTKKEGHKWISLESAKQIAFEVCKIPDDQEFLTLLNFLHDQRIVIHFDDTPELENLVVLDPQWLIDVFSKVITVKPYAHEERQFKELWHKLEATGVLDEDLLKHVWGPLLSQKETSESLIAIMEKFSLLCPWPPSAVSSTKQYLVPSMLMSHPPQDIINLVSSAQLPSLFVKFQSGQVPPGLFPRLMLQFFQWGKAEFWSRAKPHLFHNFARFYTSGDEDCSVVLLCHSSSIEVIVHRGNRGIESAKCLQSKVNLSADAHHDAFEVACACTVQRQLSLMLESMRKEFCWLRNMRYEVGVICPVCCQGGVFKYCRDHHTQGCERGDCLHFLSESELRSATQSIICTKSAAATNNKVYIKQFAPWFGRPTEQYSQQSVLKCGGRLLSSSLGNKNKSLALPRKAITELLSWKSTDPEEIVLQLEKSFQVDQSSLEQPGTETKKLIRYVASKAKRLDRLDVVKHLRKITPAGTTGPLLPGELDVRNIPVGKMKELTVDLSGGDEWKEVAERLGLSPKEIRYLDKRTMNPFDAVLAYISQQRYYINVDDLYDVLNECGLPVLADLL